MLKHWSITLSVASAILLAACGGNDNNSSSSDDVPKIVANIAVPNVNATTNFSFDIGAVLGSKYYFTDRNNAGVDVIDISSRTYSNRIVGNGALAFAGLGTKSAVSGPDGINVVGNLLYVGDVNSVKIVDPSSGAVLKSITVSATGVRADEGCLDSAHGIYMISSPDEPVPFATFIDTATQTIVAKVTFTDAAGKPSAGLEACAYDTASDSFFVNNDGTTANPHGELIRIPGAAIRGVTPGAAVNYTALQGMTAAPLGNCDPTGLALGPNTDIAVGCRENTTGAPLLLQIFNRSTGALVASLNAGGGDELAYDAASNRYYNSSYLWTATGNATTNGACSAASPCTPVLTVIDAQNRTVVARVPSGNFAHSVSVDPASKLIFMPYSSATVPAGCTTCAANGFVNGGVIVYSM